MQKECISCGNTFDITESDRTFRDMMAPVFGGRKFPFPEPLQCPDCRRKHRLQFRNERFLYKRKCALTGKEIISNYSPEKPHIVYDRSVWWSDCFDPLKWGRNFDFSRPFFDQFDEIIRSTPVFALSASPDAEETNCLFVNFASHNRNCYMMFDSDACEECYYSNAIKHSLRCLDCSYTEHSELCYDCSDCKKCYALQYSQYCDTCSESAFLKNCVGCRHCLFCKNLVQKEYCILNRPVPKAEFERAMSMLRFWENVEEGRRSFASFVLQFPEKATHVLNSEQCTGDYIANSHRIKDSYDIGESEDIAYCDALYRAKFCQDVSSFGENIEKIYNSGTIGFSVYNVACSFACRTNCSNMLHCFNCYRSHDCFCCVSLKNHQYCIFNKQYGKEEYEALVPRIIEHMQKTPYVSPDGFTGQTCEWGQYFPLQLSPFAYNETVAQEYFPLTETEAQAMKKLWKHADKEASGKETISWETYPSEIDDVPASVVKEVLPCIATGKNFRITEQELQFYRTIGIPLPRLHPDRRHRRRMDLRTPRKLWKRKCGKCGGEIDSAYQPSRPEVVYCESCYLKEVY